jgi:hypothetical protein
MFRKDRLILALLASVMSMAMPQHVYAVSQPKLVMGLIVEGLEQEQINLLKDYLSENGLKRFLRDGVSINNVDYGTNLDVTAATAVLTTGASPSVSGISDSYIFNRTSLKSEPIMEDKSFIGNYTTETYSPSALKISTIGDELKIAGNGQNLVYSIAPDAGQAILLAGHAANSAVWLNDNTGNWATTTYYKEIPAIISNRNRLQPLATRLDTMNWVPGAKAKEYTLLPEHLRHYPFHHVFAHNSSSRYKAFKNSALYNTEATDIAIEYINNLGLGKHEGTDMLSIGLTLEPFVYSKNSDTRFELIDSYLKLDQNLAKLFATIDRKVGLGNSLIYLAATPPPSQNRKDDEKWNIPSGEFSTRRAISLLNMYLMAIYGNGDWVSGYHNGQFFLNQKLIKDRNKDIKAMRIESADFLCRMTGVTSAYTLDDIINNRGGENALALSRNIVIANAGDIFINVAPGWQIIDETSTHNGASTQMVYRVAPAMGCLFILSPDLKATKIDTPVDARSIAPTITRLLRIRSPNGASIPSLQLN